MEVVGGRWTYLAPCFYPNLLFWCINVPKSAKKGLYEKWPPYGNSTYFCTHFYGLIRVKYGLCTGGFGIRILYVFCTYFGFSPKFIKIHWNQAKIHLEFPKNHRISLKVTKFDHNPPSPNSAPHPWRRWRINDIYQGNKSCYLRLWGMFLWRDLYNVYYIMVYHIQVQVFPFDMSGNMVHLDPRVERTSHQNNASFAGGFASPNFSIHDSESNSIPNR